MFTKTSIRERMKVSMSVSEFALAAAARIATSRYPEYEFTWVAKRLEAARHGLLHIASRETSHPIQIMSDVWGTEYPTEVLSWDASGLSWVRDSVTSTENSTDGVYALACVSLLKITPNKDINNWTREQIFEWVDTKSGIANAEKAAKAVYDSVWAKARTLINGVRVIVARGRKVPVGTTGKVISITEGQWGTRVGIATSDLRDLNGRFKDVVWTAASNADVITPANVEEQAQAEMKAAYKSAFQSTRNAWLKTLSDFGITREAPKVIAEVQDGEEE